MSYAFGQGSGDMGHGPGHYDPNTGTLTMSNGDTHAIAANTEMGQKLQGPGDQTPFDPKKQLGVGQYYNEKTGFDPNEYMYGGTPGMEKSEADYFRNKATNYDQRAAPTLDYGLANQSRGQQSDALGLMRSAAMGQAPSVAAMQQQQGLNQAMGMQMSAAASARGGGPSQALAARTAMMQGGDMQQSAVGQAAMLRAQEMAQARGEYMGGAQGMRTQDEGRTQYGGDLAMRQQQLNDQSSLTADNMRSNVFAEADKGRLAKQANLLDANKNSNGINAQTSRDNAAVDAANQADTKATVGKAIEGAGNAAYSQYQMGQVKAPAPAVAAPIERVGGGPGSGDWDIKMPPRTG